MTQTTIQCNNNDDGDEEEKEKKEDDLLLGIPEVDEPDDSLKSESDTEFYSSEQSESEIGVESIDTNNNAQKKNHTYDSKFLLQFKECSDMPQSMIDNKEKIAGILKNSNSNFAQHSNSSKKNSNKKNNKKGGGGGGIKNHSSAPNTPRRIISQNPNAWKVPDRSTDTEEGKRTEFSRKVNGILNRITLENFDSLSQQLINEILSLHYVEDVINQIFDKALDEPKFAMIYSKLCGAIYVQLRFSSMEEGNEFRKLLLNKCQEQFKKKIVSDQELDKEVYYKNKLRYLGNIKFIGELYIAKLIPITIIFLSSTELLCEKDGSYNEDEDSLESLCKLLTTTGKLVSESIQKKPQNSGAFEGIFSTLNYIRNNSDISSRIKYMIMDLEDLKRDNWIPRRKLEGPMKIADVHKEAKKLAEDKMLNRLTKSSSNITPIRSLNQSSDSNDNSNRDLRKSSASNLNDFKEVKGGGNSNRGKVPASKTPSSSWRKKSSNTLNNSFHSLEIEKPKKEEPIIPSTQIDNDDSSNNNTNINNDDNNNNNNNNDNNNNDNNNNNNDNNNDNNDNIEIIPLPVVKQSFTSSFKSSIDEYFDIFDEIEVKEALLELNPGDALAEFITCLVNKTTNKNRVKQTSKLIKYLFSENVISVNHFENAFESVFEVIEETVEDLPNATSFYGELFGCLFSSNILSFSFLEKLLSNDISSFHRTKIIVNFLKAALLDTPFETLISKMNEVNFEVLKYCELRSLENDDDLKEISQKLQN